MQFFEYFGTNRVKCIVLLFTTDTEYEWHQVTSFEPLLLTIRRTDQAIAMRIKAENRRLTAHQGRSDGGGYRYLYPPPQKKKTSQVNFLWDKNDVRTAIQQFYTPLPKNLYPQNKFLATPLQLMCSHFP